MKNGQKNLSFETMEKLNIYLGSSPLITFINIRKTFINIDSKSVTKMPKYDRLKKAHEDSKYPTINIDLPCHPSIIFLSFVSSTFEPWKCGCDCDTWRRNGEISAFRGKCILMPRTDKQVRSHLCAQQGARSILSSVFYGVYCLFVSPHVMLAVESISLISGSSNCKDIRTTKMKTFTRTARFLVHSKQSKARSTWKKKEAAKPKIEVSKETNINNIWQYVQRQSNTAQAERPKKCDSFKFS